MKCVVLYIIFHLNLVLVVLGKSNPVTDCGFPGVPQWGIVTIMENEQTVANWNYSMVVANMTTTNYNYRENAIALYQCQSTGHFILRGSKQRRCLWNGNWEHHVPYCEENVAYKLPATIPGINDTEWLTDGRMNYSEKHAGLRQYPEQYIELNFTHPINVKTVVVYFTGADGNITDAEMFHDNQTRCHFKQLFKHFIQYDCSNIVNVTRKIHFHHYSKMSYQIVEIQVFRRPDERKHCGIPSIPSNGHISFYPNHSNPEWVDYTCSSGYHLSGSTRKNCTGLTWVGPVSVCSVHSWIEANKTEIDVITSVGMTTEMNKLDSPNETLSQADQSRINHSRSMQVGETDAYWLFAAALLIGSLVIVFAGLYFYTRHQHKQSREYSHLSLFAEDDGVDQLSVS